MTNDKKISKPKISTENKHHRANSLLSTKENKDKEKKWERETKVEEQWYKKTLIVGDSIIKHVDGWRLNRRMKSIVSVCSISSATKKAMKQHVTLCGLINAG